MCCVASFSVYRQRKDFVFRLVDASANCSHVIVVTIKRLASHERLRVVISIHLKLVIRGYLLLWLLLLLSLMMMIVQ